MTTPADGKPQHPTAEEHDEPAPDATPDDIERDIEATRERLADTVDELTQKLDVKARAKDQLSSLRDDATRTAHDLGGRAKAMGSTAQEKPAVPAAVVAGLLLLVVVTVWRKRR